ncbi:dNMP kinase [Vibrio phage nt-1]|uniref:DNMP kinase n=1 Tax=Vibrio phage nt-1 TaxID=115992 RepID=R9TJ25_9CAUD|nr:dNMP kinase [Vibrio phage nt-1]AGN30375.1 dNMP kinase [Vibrio phage nt-1]
MIIGINGQKRSGKDTVAEILKESHSDNAYIYKFADPIKEGLFIKLKEYGYEYADIDGQNNFDREVPTFTFDEAVEIVLTCCEYAKVDADYNYVYYSLLRHTGLFSIRDLLQMTGTDVARSLDDQHWINYARNKYNELVFNNPNLVFIITDVRFENELQLVQELGGTMLQVTRDGSLASNHISDTELGHINDAIQIDNNGSLEELHEQINNLF